MGPTIRFPVQINESRLRLQNSEPTITFSLSLLAIMMPARIEALHCVLRGEAPVRRKRAASRDLPSIDRLVPSQSLMMGDASLQRDCGGLRLGDDG